MQDEVEGISLYTYLHINQFLAWTILGMKIQIYGGKNKPLIAY